MSQATNAMRSLSSQTTGDSPKPVRTSKSCNGAGFLDPTVQIQGRTAALESTERNASRRPSGDQTLLKKPTYLGSFDVMVRNVRVFASATEISLVGMAGSSVQPGLVISTAAKGP